MEEALTFLKHWRAGRKTTAADDIVADHAAPVQQKTSEAEMGSDSDAYVDEESSSTGEEDEGPFFDFEFAAPGEEACRKAGGFEEEQEQESSSNSSGGDGSTFSKECGGEHEGGAEEEEFNFAMSSDGSCGCEQNLVLSPCSDDLFFKGRLLPLLEPSSVLVHSSESDVKYLPVSLLKSAAKLRVFMLNMKKKRPKALEACQQAANASNSKDGSNPATPLVPQHQHQHQPEKKSKLLMLKFIKVEEVPIVSFFSRDSSSSSTRSSGSSCKKPEKKAVGDQQQEEEDEDEDVVEVAAVEEKKLSKELVQKYLDKIRPLYMRVSKRYWERLSTSSSFEEDPPPEGNPPVPEEDEASASASASALVVAAEATPANASIVAAKSQKLVMAANHLPAKLRVVCKQLGKKGLSASSAVAAVPSTPPALPSRRDDSLLQQQDGIQSAIAHCKRSLNASPTATHGTTADVGSPPRRDECGGEGKTLESEAAQGIAGHARV